jgi:dihydrofolate reductase
MKIILVVAISQDGFITDKNGRVTSWTSKEDQKFFSEMLDKHNLLVMGSNTYDKADSKALPGKLKVVLTSQPEKYAVKQVTGQLEFRKLHAEEFVDTYKGAYDACLLLGGSYLYTDFLEKGLVEEMYITIEPVVLGDGVPLLRNNKRLADIVKDMPKPTEKLLNEKGTVLQHYILK